MLQNQAYQAPQLTTIEIKAEGGFAASSSSTTPPWEDGGEW